MHTRCKIHLNMLYISKFSLNYFELCNSPIYLNNENNIFVIVNLTNIVEYNTQELNYNESK